jgi:hypothetical protein
MCILLWLSLRAWDKFPVNGYMEVDTQDNSQVPLEILNSAVQQPRQNSRKENINR